MKRSDDSDKLGRRGDGSDLRDAPNGHWFEMAMDPSPSFPRKRESRGGGGCYSGVSPLHPAWIPAFAGMTERGAGE